MHEMALGSAVVNTATKHANGRPVKVVVMSIGKLRQVVPDSLSFYFDIIAKDTICDGAKLEINIVPALLRCEACTKEWEPDFPTFRCPFCMDSKVTVLSGEEFMVESLEVEEDEPCIAPK
jgi:hydrogenase nickel incorporation protein HypA/HybF